VIQKFYVPGRDIGIDHLRQCHYIGGDEKKGFTISEMDISLPDQRLKLFARGRTDWRVENIGKRVKKSKRGRLIEGTSASAQQEDLEVNFPPPSSAYWRNEFQGASSGQGYPQG
jgi:ribosomal protein S6E (S10)